MRRRAGFLPKADANQVDFLSSTVYRNGNTRVNAELAALPKEELLLAREAASGARVRPIERASCMMSTLYDGVDLVPVLARIGFNVTWRKVGPGKRHQAPIVRSRKSRVLVAFGAYRRHEQLL